MIGKGKGCGLQARHLWREASIEGSEDHRNIQRRTNSLAALCVQAKKKDKCAVSGI